MGSITGSMGAIVGGLGAIAKTTSGIVGAKHEQKKKEVEVLQLMKKDLDVKEAVKTYNARRHILNTRIQETARQNLLDVVEYKMKQKKQFEDRISKLVLSTAEQEDK